MIGLIKNWLDGLDLNDPVDRALYRFYILACRLLLLMVALVVAVLVFGVPAIQTTYQYNGVVQPNGWVAAEDKFIAWYLTPFGWRPVFRNQYGQRGCPVLLFIPISDLLTDSK